MNTGFDGKKELMPYKKAIKIVQRKKFSSVIQYNSWKDRPKSIPFFPYKHYKEWKNWYVWLGIKQIKLLSFKEAKKLVQKHGIKTREEYQKFRKGKKQLPFNPHLAYSNTKQKNYRNLVQKNHRHKKREE